MRLISDGVVDREGVPGLAGHLGYTPRHLTRLLTAELGAGPLALARARRAQTARVLIETTEPDLRRRRVRLRLLQRPAVQRHRPRGLRRPPRSELRGRRGAGGAAATGAITMRLAVRTPYAAEALLDFLAHHVVPGVEAVGPGWYARTLDLPHGPGTVRLDLAEAQSTREGATAFVPATFELTDLRDTTAAVERARRLLDADCDPVAVDAHFAGDPVVGPLVRRRPGLRVPGQVDGDEVAVRTVIGQQVSVAGARTVGARLVAAHGRPVRSTVPGLTHLFPDAATLAGVDPATLPMPRARGRAVVGAGRTLADGSIALDRGRDRAAVRDALLTLPGIGPWTADYVAMRALGHPDVFLPTDLGVRNALVGLGHDPAASSRPPASWSPWRSYALLHLWQTLMPPTPHATPADRPEEN